MTIQQANHTQDSVVSVTDDGWPHSEGCPRDGLCKHWITGDGGRGCTHRYTNGPIAVIGSTLPDIPEPEPAPPLPEFPTHLLPPSMRWLVESESTRLGIPAGMLALPALVVAAAAIGGSRVVRTDDRLHPAALWGVLVARSSAGKSPAMDVALAPFRDAARVRAQERDDAWNRLEQWQHDRSKEKGEAPWVPPPMLTTDPTTEALAELLSNAPRGLLLTLDELTAWANGMDAYRKGSSGPDRGRYCSIWSGADISIERKGQRPVVAISPVLSILGGIQPTVLGSLNSGPDGLAQRFLYSHHPDFEEQYPSRQLADPEILKGWRWTIDSLLDRTPWSTGPVVVPMTAEAIDAWYDGRKRCVDEQRQHGSSEFYGKFTAYSARLALVLTLAEDPEATSVNVAAVDAAWAMCLGYFAPHGIDALADTWQDNSPEARLVQWVVKKGGAVALRDIVHSFERQYRTMDAARRLLARTTARGLLKTEVRHPEHGGRKATWAVLP